MRRRALANGTPYVKTSVVVLGEDQIDTWDALCLIAGRKPYQLAADVLLEYIRAHRLDDGVEDLVRARREFQAAHAPAESPRLRLVRGGE